MASFSFGAGNARKLVRIPFYLLGRLATLVIPRRPGSWVFGCGVGIGDGALALWQVAVADGLRPVWLVDSARERADAAARGIPVAARHSLRGFWLTARAAIVVVTHGFGDVNRYAIGGAFVVQLWHGIPLKRIGLDSPETLRLPGVPARLTGPARAVLRTLYRRTASAIGVLPAASHLVRGRLESAFGLPDARVPVTGEPRVDVLSRGTAQERYRVARELIGDAVGEIADGARIVLYAPTWRDGEPDPAVPTVQEWRELVALLEESDAVLLVRSHPLGAGDYRPPQATDRVRAIGSDRVADITPALPAVDVLITDYSSLIFDAGLVPVPVVFFAPDLVAYTRRRGLYGRYRDVADTCASDWSEVVEMIRHLLDDDDARRRAVERSAAVSRRVHAFRDGGNTERVYRAILARARGRARERTRG